MEITLVIKTAAGGERVFPIEAPRTVIGRETRCDVRVPLPTVEDRHCEIVLADGFVELKDLGSDGGTFRNGDRVQQARLAHADLIKIGPVTFEVRMGGQNGAAVPGMLAPDPGPDGS